MDASSLKEIGSFAAVVAPVTLGALWLVKMLFGWFTKTLDAERQQREAVNQELIGLMKDQQQAHTQMIQLITEGRVQSQREHERIINGLERGR